MALGKRRGLKAAPLPRGSRAPAPEPSNGEQAGQHTAYPELLELGPGQGGQGGTEEEPHSLQALESGQVPEGLYHPGCKSHTLWALMFHL